MNLTKYWKQLGPIITTLLAIANVLGPKWPPGYIIAGVLGALINLFGPPNQTTSEKETPTPIHPSIP